VPEADRLRNACLSFADTQARGFSPLYEQLAVGIAHDAALLDLLSNAPSGQQRPTLLLAAVHELLLQGVQHPLAVFYPSVTATPGTGDPLPAFADFCATFRSEVLSRIARGATQTNEVRRGAALIVGLHHLQATASGPLHLIELGASAGLLLAFDRYLYELDGRQVGPSDSPVRIPVSADHDVIALWPAAPPVLASRIGVDRRPIDLRDPAERRWLEAFVWPEALDDRRRLQAAAQLVAQRPPAVIAGDAVDTLADLLADTDRAAHPVVFHSTLFTYLRRDQRHALVDVVSSIGRARDLSWLALEAPGFLTAPDIDFDIPLSVAADNSRQVLAARQWTNRASHDAILAQADAYGRSLTRNGLSPARST
jgi:hypothetical protein